MMYTSKLDVQRARDNFPGLDSDYILADNAGGSQALKAVAEATYDYLLHSNVQLFASYTKSQLSTTRVYHGSEAAAVIFNAASADEIAFGPSARQLFSNLALSITPLMREGDELVLTGEHDANAGPWTTLAANFHPPLPVHFWKPVTSSSINPYALSYNAAFSGLSPLLNSRTRIVALPACSNVLGELLDMTEAVRIIRDRAPNAWIVADLVAYAPHRSIDVSLWDVDFAAISFYKMFGPHTGALYIRQSALKRLTSIVHPAIDVGPGKLQPGGPGYELTYAASVVLPYLTGLSTPDVPTTRQSQRQALERTSDLFEKHETTLCGILLDFLTSPRARARGVRVVGPEEAGPTRTPKVCFFVLEGEQGERALGSREIVEYTDGLGTLGIRSGHFYTHNLVKTLPGFGTPTGRSPDDGLVRVSLVHYNTVEEAQRIVRLLEGILFESNEQKKCPVSNHVGNGSAFDKSSHS